MVVNVDARELSVNEIRNSGTIKFVDDNKSYRFLLQLGSNNRWRKYNGGDWKRNPEGDSKDGDMKAWRHVSAVHEVGPLFGRELNGLISSANKWLDCNVNHVRPDGDINRMIWVSQIEETDELPDRGPIRRLNAKSIELIASSVAKGLMEQMQQGNRSGGNKRSSNSN